MVGKNLFLFGGKRTNSEDEDGKLFILDLGKINQANVFSFFKKNRFIIY